MAYTYGFEKLEVWQEAKDFTLEIYRISTDFPDVERFGLSSQLRRASVSICSNLAEGSTCASSKKQAYFSTIAFGSAVETINQLVIARELDLISEKSYTFLREKLESITNKINALRSYQLRKNLKKN